MNAFKYSVIVNGQLHKFDSPSKASLLADVSRFFEKNNISFNKDDVGSAIDRQSRIVVKNTGKKLSFTDAVHGAMAILKHASGVSVSNGEIIRRSAICASCPQRSAISMCYSCGTAGKISKWVSSIREKFKLQIGIPSEVKFLYCGLCKCSIPLMVVSKREAFVPETADKNRTRPDVCWLKKTSTNYTNE